MITRPSLPPTAFTLILHCVSRDSRELFGALCPVSRACRDRVATDATAQSLCLRVFRVRAEQLREWPSLSSWWALFRVLSTWAPREGFYALPHAAPWGLVLLLRFRAGAIVGEVLKGGAAGETRTEVLRVRFDERGRPHARACGAPVALVARPEGVAVPGDPSGVAPVSPLPGNGAGRYVGVARFDAPGLLIERREPVMYEGGGGDDDDDDDEGSHVRAVRRARRAWAIDAPGDAAEMVASLLALAAPGLLLRAVDGPAVARLAAGRDGAPAIRPGLYVGAFGPQYGQHRRKTLLVEHRRFALATPGDEAAWSRIAREIFLTHERSQHDRPVDRRADPNVRNSRAAPFWQTARDACVRARATEVVFAVGLKVTGDLHVPAGAVTWGALVRPALADGDEVAPYCGRRDGGGRDRFERSTTVRDREDDREERVADAWFGWGTLAFPGFAEPSWSSGQLCRLREEPSATGGAAAPSGRFAFTWHRARDDSATVLHWLPAQETHPFLEVESDEPVSTPPRSPGTHE